MMPQVTLTVNGKTHTVEVEGRTLLVELLREKLREHLLRRLLLLKLEHLLVAREPALDARLPRLHAAHGRARTLPAHGRAEAGLLRARRAVALLKLLLCERVRVACRLPLQVLNDLLLVGARLVLVRGLEARHLH